MGIALIISVALPSRSSLAMLDLVKAAYVAGSPDLLEADLAGLCVGQQPLSATRPVRDIYEPRLRKDRYLVQVCARDKHPIDACWRTKPSFDQGGTHFIPVHSSHPSIGSTS